MDEAPGGALPLTSREITRVLRLVNRVSPGLCYWRIDCLSFVVSGEKDSGLGLYEVVVVLLSFVALVGPLFSFRGKGVKRDGDSRVHTSNKRSRLYRVHTSLPRWGRSLMAF